jgi:hypothetical protein
MRERGVAEQGVATQPNDDGDCAAERSHVFSPCGNGYVAVLKHGRKRYGVLKYVNSDSGLLGLLGFLGLYEAELIAKL